MVRSPIFMNKRARWRTWPPRRTQLLIAARAILFALFLMSLIAALA